MSIRKQRISLRLALALTLFAGLASVNASAQAPIATPPPLPAPEIRLPVGPRMAIADGTAQAAYDVQVADMNGNGYQDVVGAVFQGATTGNGVAWFENVNGDGSQWTQHVIDASQNGATSVWPVDVMGNGRMDVLATIRNVAKGRDTVIFYENTAEGWVKHIIADDFLASFFGYPGDINGNGRIDFVATATGRDVTAPTQKRVTWWENTGDPDNWIEHEISVDFNDPYGVELADIDQDGDLDVLVTSNSGNEVAWFENVDGAGGAWTKRTIDAAAPGAYHATAADINGNGYLDIVASSYSGNRIHLYINDKTPRDGGWVKSNVVENYAQARNVRVVDMDLDGKLDIVTHSYIGNTVDVFINVDGLGGSWRRVAVATGETNINSVTVGDISGDGDMDIVGAVRALDDIVWWENRTIHRSATFPQASAISSTFQANDVAVGDFNRNGILDVAAVSGEAVAWFDGSTGTWQQRVVDPALAGGVSIAAVDVDGDGWLDLVVGASNTGADPDIVWYRNTGSGNAWTKNVLETGLNGVAEIFAVDLNQNGKVDILAAASGANVVKWYQNNGEATGWTSANVGPGLPQAAAVFAADVSGNGQLDVVAGSAGAGGMVVVFWNNGGATTTWAQTRVDRTFPGAVAVGAADMNGNGCVDVVAVSSTDGDVAWYTNPGLTTDVEWTANVVDANLPGVNSLAVADFDIDGKMDIVAASTSGNVVATYRRTNTAWVKATSEVASPAGLAFGRIDRDADLDLAVAQGAGNVSVMLNGGGQAAMIARDTAPVKIDGGQMGSMLAIEMAHRGRAGDSPAELARLALLFRAPDGAPLTTTQINAILSNVHVYADTGNGSFDPSDTLLATVANPFLFDGVLTVVIPDGHEAARVAAAANKSFFVVVEFTEDAAQHTPAGFTITHLNDTGSLAEDFTNDSALFLEYAANVTSSLTYAGDENPEAISITRHTPSRENASSEQVAFAVLFSEYVSGVTIDNFSLVTAGGQTGATLSHVDGANPIEWLVWVNTVAQNGTIGLRLDRNLDSIVDMDGLPDPLLVGLNESEFFSLEFDKPVSQITAPASGTTTDPLWNLQWTSSDPGAAPSGVATVEIYWIRNNFQGQGVPVLLGSFPPDVTSATFDAASWGGGTYEFYSIAIDAAGNVEDRPATADVTITIELPASGIDHWQRY